MQWQFAQTQWDMLICVGECISDLRTALRMVRMAFLMSMKATEKICKLEDSMTVLLCSCDKLMLPAIYFSQLNHWQMAQLLPERLQGR